MTDTSNPFENLDPKRVTIELQIKDPHYYTLNPDGTRQVTVMTDYLRWLPVELVADSAACDHGETVCYECADSWGEDYWMKILVDGNVVWMSPDFPVGPDELTNPDDPDHTPPTDEV